jgi:hypothetical protein
VMIESDGMQALKGIATAGAMKALKYGAAKLGKYWTARA